MLISGFFEITFFNTFFPARTVTYNDVLIAEVRMTPLSMHSND